MSKIQFLLWFCMTERDSPRVSVMASLDSNSLFDNVNFSIFKTGGDVDAECGG